MHVLCIVYGKDFLKKVTKGGKLQFMKKSEILYKEDKNGVLMVRAFMLMKESKFNSADRWWMLNEFHRWLEAQREINRLYGYKPSNWISDSHQWSQIKLKSMRNIVAFVRSHYATRDDMDSPTSPYYGFLNNLFGKDNWNE